MLIGEIISLRQRGSLELGHSNLEVFIVLHRDPSQKMQVVFLEGVLSVMLDHKVSTIRKSL